MTSSRELRVGVVGEDEVVEREARRDERGDALERVLGLAPCDLPHEVAVERAAGPGGRHARAGDDLGDVALGEREAGGDHAGERGGGRLVDALGRQLAAPGGGALAVGRAARTSTT